MDLDCNGDLSVEKVMRESVRISLEHGFQIDPEPNLERAVVLIMTELAEIIEDARRGAALDNIRHSNEVGPDGKVSCIKPDGIPAEFADVVIRVCQFCQRYNIPLVQAMREKMAYNEVRPYRHGGKLW